MEAEKSSNLSKTSVISAKIVVLGDQSNSPYQIFNKEFPLSFSVLQMLAKPVL